MTEQQALKYLKDANRNNQMVGILPKSDIAKCLIKALEEIQQYRAIGTVEKIKEELDHLRNDNDCQGLYFTLEERQDLARQHRELEEYRAIGTPDECRSAVEKQNPHKWEHGIDDDVLCSFCATMTKKTLMSRYCSFCGQRLE